jgi:hypothetical protein
MDKGCILQTKCEGYDGTNLPKCSYFSFAELFLRMSPHSFLAYTETEVHLCGNCLITELTMNVALAQSPTSPSSTQPYTPGKSIILPANGGKQATKTYSKKVVQFYLYSHPHTDIAGLLHILQSSW